MAAFKDLLVQLYVPLKNSDKGRIGTAYPVGQDLILTARHNLFADKVDQDQPFEIRWYKLPEGEPARQWQPVQHDAVVWRGSGELDAVLFKYPLPEELNDWRGLSPRSPRGLEKWESEGFADSGRLDQRDRRESVCFDGCWHTPGSADAQASLRVEGSFDTEQGWQGASGSPVFVGEEIIALVTEWRPHFKGTKLKSVRAERLLADKGLRKQLGYPDKPAWGPALHKQITPVSTAAAAALEQQLSHRDTRRIDAGVRKDLETALLACNGERLVQAGFEALDTLANPADRRSLCALIRGLLPLLHDADTVGWVQHLIAKSSPLLLGFPVTTELVAEIVMAGTDGRSVECRAVAEDGLAEGVLSLRMDTSDLGIDPHGERAAEAEATHLARLYSVADEVFEPAFETALLNTIPERQRARLRNARESAQTMVVNHLRRNAEQRKRRLYYLFDLPDEREQRDACLNTLRRLKHKYDPIAFLELVRDDELAIQQADAFDLLLDILAAELPTP